MQPTQKWIVLPLIALIGALAVARPWQGASNSQSRKRDFELSDPSGKKFLLHELKGRFSVIHFWASWCPPCLNEIGEWVSFSENFKNRPISFIAISGDTNWNDAESVLKPALKPQELISLLDPTEKVAQAFGSYQFPETYLLNEAHEVMAKWVGAQPWNDPKFKVEFEKVLSTEHR